MTPTVGLFSKPAVQKLKRVGVGVIAAAMVAIGFVLFVQARSTTASVDASRFVPVSPQRILDSRPGTGPADDGVDGALKSGQSIDVQITGRGGVPESGVTAVVLNVTITDAAEAGWVQVFPTARSHIGDSSNVNVEYAGQTIANQVTVAVGSGGRVSIYTTSGGHLLADVSGYYAQSQRSTDGRYTPLLAPTPRRVVDTRDPMQVPTANPGDTMNCDQFATWDESWRWFWKYRRWGDPAQLDPDHDGIPCNELPGKKTDSPPTDLFKLGRGATLRIPVLNDTNLAGGFTRPGRASAVVANITVTQASAPGFWQVIPTGGASLGSSSNLNVERAGQNVANQVIVPLGADGTITIYSQNGGHVIVDITGVFTGSGSPSSTYGLFVPISPSRLVDTRESSNTPVVGRLSAGGQLMVNSADRFGIPNDVSALAVNATATDARRPGFVQVFPPGGSTPGASSTLNIEHIGETISNATYATLDSTGQFSIYTRTGANLVVDVAGWFTSGPVSAPAAGAPARSSIPSGSTDTEVPSTGESAITGEASATETSGLPESPDTVVPGAATGSRAPTTPPTTGGTIGPPGPDTTSPPEPSGPGPTSGTPTTTPPPSAAPPTTQPPTTTQPPETTPPPTTPPNTTTTTEVPVITVPDTTTTLPPLAPKPTHPPPPTHPAL